MYKEIVYGVQGEGRGHATRSLEIIQLLTEKGYKISIFTGGDALRFFRETSLPLHEIPSFRYKYTSSGKLSLTGTLFHNLLPALGLFMAKGKKYREIFNQIKNIKPRIIISDFEPYTCRLARSLRIPLASINHQHFFTECRIPQQHRLSRNLLIFIFQFSTRLMTGKPQQIIASSFHHFPKLPHSRALLVGPIITKQLRDLAPLYTNQVVVYFKKTEYAYRLLPLFTRIKKINWKVFADFSACPMARLEAPHIQYHPIDRNTFLTELAHCRGLITTAGNQVLGEAIYLHKPILAFPEPDVVEQELNGQALNHSGAGLCYPLESLSLDILRKFVRQLPPCTSRPQVTTRPRYDGSTSVLKGIESLLQMHPVTT